MSSVLSPITIGSPQSAAPSNFDLEAAVLATTLERISLFDGQIADLMQKMKERNTKAANYNAVLQELNKIKNAFKNDAKAGDKVDKTMVEQYKKDFEKACQEAGLTPDVSKKIDNKSKISEQEAIENQAIKDIADYKKRIAEKEKQIENEPNKREKAFLVSEKNALVNEHNAKIKIKDAATAQLKTLKAQHNPDGAMTDATTKADIENAISRVQGLVDENNNTSQMDQLQLQSLISKRNAQFEMASTVVKKIIDSVLAITSNMR
ncbi:MAG: hypothetical protein WBC18_06175 [Ottowia sp.]|uniref:hypothetical protein n=1 Tax=unclassified Ottowia TaxID=2645081 RepID=UPI003C2E405C